MSEILPFYWPTKTIALDDDAEFASTVSDCVSNKRKSEYYTDPEQVLCKVNSQKFDFSWYMKKIGVGNFGEDDFNIDYNSIKLALNKDNRFDLFSVIVVDYHMPQILGTEFCKKVDSSGGMKNILLTGNVDYKNGIDYLNEKQIDAFLAKKDLNLDNINDLVLKQEKEFFKFHSRKLTDFLRSVEPNNPIFQKDYKNYFDEILERFNISEYYMLNDIGWYLLVDTKGNKKILYLFDEEDLLEMEKEAAYIGVTKKIYNRIKTKKAAICNYDPEYLGMPDRDDWEFYLQEIEPLMINNRKYFASVRDFKE